MVRSKLYTQGVSIVRSKQYAQDLTVVRSKQYVLGFGLWVCILKVYL